MAASLPRCPALCAAGGYVPILLTAGKDGVLNVLEARRFVPIAQLRCAMHPPTTPCCRRNAQSVRDSHPDFRVSTGWAGVCLSADSKYAAAGSADGTLLVWQVDTKKVVFKKKEHTYVTAHHCRRRRRWHNERAADPASAHRSAITCVDWSPLGTQLASCDKSGAIVLWE